MATEWMKHVKKTMKEHKGSSLADVLKMAKKTYKKQKGGDGEAAAPSGFTEGTDLTFAGPSNASPSAPVRDAAPVGGRRRRTVRKSKKSKKSKKTRKH
jgi:hypothetical protein